MHKLLVPAVITAMLITTACASDGGQTLPPDSSGQAADSSPAVPEAPGVEPVDELNVKPDEELGNEEIAGAEGLSTSEETSVPEEPPVVWYPKGIGMPLTTDAPAHQNDKVVMLTFDDGPSETDSTAQILDVLKEKQVKAVFFVTGYGAKHTDMLKRIASEGHEIGLHTMTHQDLSALTPVEIREELEPLIQTVEEVTGQRPKYLRPPFGSYNDDVLAVANDLGLEVITWTSGSLDWEDNDENGYKDPAVVVQDVMDQLYPGAVYLFHDTKTHTAEALPEIIDRMRADGYEFVVLS